MSIQHLILLFIFITWTNMLSFSQTKQDSLIQILSNPNTSEEIKKKTGKAYIDLLRKNLIEAEMAQYFKLEIDQLSEEKFIYYVRHDSTYLEDKKLILEEMAQIGSKKSLRFLVSNLTKIHFQSPEIYGEEDLFDYYCFYVLDQKIKDKTILTPFLLETLSTETQGDLHLIFSQHLFSQINKGDHQLLDSIITLFIEMQKLNPFLFTNFNSLKKIRIEFYGE